MIKNKILTIIIRSDNSINNNIFFNKLEKYNVIYELISYSIISVVFSEIIISFDKKYKYDINRAYYGAYKSNLYNIFNEDRIRKIKKLRNVK